MIDLGPRLRLVAAAGCLALQGALVLTASMRTDHAFGFRLFEESSTFEIRLSREVAAPGGRGTVLVPVRDGEWIAKNRDGAPRLFRWRDRVQQPSLSSFHGPALAPHGVAADLAHLAAALEDVAGHTPEDAETIALIAEVTVQKNGHEPAYVRLASAPRR